MVVIICYLDYVLIPAMLAYVMMFFIVIRIYMCSSKSLFHLEGIMREPIFALMSSTIGGLATIRASKKTGKVKREFYTAQVSKNERNIRNSIIKN